MCLYTAKIPAQVREFEDHRITEPTDMGYGTIQVCWQGQQHGARNIGRNVLSRVACLWVVSFILDRTYRNCTRYFEYEHKIRSNKTNVHPCECLAFDELQMGDRGFIARLCRLSASQLLRFIGKAIIPRKYS